MNWSNFQKLVIPVESSVVGRNSFIFVARASLSFILMSWQVWLSLCWDGQLSHTHTIAETQLFPQLLSFGIYAGALLTNSSVAPQHRNPIPKVATENSLQQVQPRFKTRSKDFPTLLLLPSPAQWANFGDCLSPALAGTFRIAVTLWHPSGGGKICSKSLWHQSAGCNVCDKISWHPINQERQIFWQTFL